MDAFGCTYNNLCGWRPTPQSTAGTQVISSVLIVYFHEFQGTCNIVLVLSRGDLPGFSNASHHCLLRLQMHCGWCKAFFMWMIHYDFLRGSRLAMRFTTFCIQMCDRLFQLNRKKSLFENLKALGPELLHSRREDSSFSGTCCQHPYYDMQSECVMWHF